MDNNRYTTLIYKGYRGKYTSEDGQFNGVVDGIRDIIHFSASSLDNVEQEFRDSVDDYLAWAKEDGFEPEVPVVECSEFKVG